MSRYHYCITHIFVPNVSVPIMKSGSELGRKVSLIEELLIEYPDGICFEQRGYEATTIRHYFIGKAGSIIELENVLPAIEQEIIDRDKTNISFEEMNDYFNKLMKLYILK